MLDLNYNPNSNFMNFNIDNVPLSLTYKQPNKNCNNSQQQGSATNQGEHEEQGKHEE